MKILSDEFVENIRCAKVVSFDLFGTLIANGASEDVCDLYALIGRIAGAPIFAECRAAAEKNRFIANAAHRRRHNPAIDLR